MTAGAIEDFKLGLKPKPNENNIAIFSSSSREDDCRCTGAIDDFKPGLKPKPNEKKMINGRCNRRF